MSKTFYAKIEVGDHCFIGENLLALIKLKSNAGWEDGYNIISIKELTDRRLTPEIQAVLEKAVKWRRWYGQVLTGKSTTEGELCESITAYLFHNEKTCPTCGKIKGTTASDPPKKRWRVKGMYKDLGAFKYLDEGVEYVQENPPYVKLHHDENLTPEALLYLLSHFVEVTTCPTCNGKGEV